jgi:hypothetical protein
LARGFIYYQIHKKLSLEEGVKSNDHKNQEERWKGSTVQY